jgi:hypothetical protein
MKIVIMFVCFFLISLVSVYVVQHYANHGVIDVGRRETAPERERPR